MYKVYAHVFPNEKVYVGITQQTLENRWKKGKGYSIKAQPIIAKAINKYGWEETKHIVLFDNLSKQEAENIEKHFICGLQLYDTEYGYNSTKGGETNEPSERTKAKIADSVKKRWQNEENRNKYVNAMKGKKKSEQGRLNISKAQKERFKNEEQRKHISEIQKGKKRSEIAKQRTSESLKKFYSIEENKKKHRKQMQEITKRQCKKVLCIELNREFASIKDASEWLGLTHQNLSACLRGKRHTFGGYHWQFIN
jgi:group I intron endonuclease